MSNKGRPSDYILGLDLGPSSIGWAIIGLKNGKPAGIEAAGVRRFEAGVQGDIEGGRDESRATQRRDARGPRRQTWRRQHREKKIFRLLSTAGLLPATEDNSPDVRHNALLSLDAGLREKHVPAADRVAAHVLPYRLRALSLDEKLDLHAVGRALYHLSQRRGYQSNMKAAKEDDDRGVVKQGISELQQAITAAKARTLGEYFAGLDPEEHRIRSRWTSRQMYLDEFDAIWEAQSKHHRQLTDDLKQEIHDAFFFQRRLKSQKHLIGHCSLEPNHRHAPLACLAAQRFRLLQRLNDLEAIKPDGELIRFTPEERPEDREKLLAALEEKGDITWAAVRKLLGMKKSKEYNRDWEFNFQQGGDKKMIGNRTSAKLFGVLGDTWTAVSVHFPERDMACTGG